MSIQTDLEAINTARNQAQDFFAARAALENATNVVAEELARFKAIKASGSFTTIPMPLKNAMLAWEAIYNAAKASFLADADVKAIFNWRP